MTIKGETKEMAKKKTEPVVPEKKEKPTPAYLRLWLRDRFMRSSVAVVR